ncbi:MAG TPA: chemotaxis response regulator protein-glutamate methylesterase [Acidimicrobiales bacterium]|nr:chemotaxis response regulator protein-glutamate methylesterase [Acidimicrobiales bacterium]
MTAPPVRVLLVDDSAVIRRFVSEALQEEPDIVVAATASNGRQAIERLERELPDVVVLDVEMPVLDGLATLAELRPRWPDVPVVMYSTLTQRGAAATLDALSLGATDYVLKPSHVADRDAAGRVVRSELAPVVRSWGNLHRARLAAARPAPAKAPPARVPAPAPTLRARVDRTRPEVLVIGSSTGGPHALTEVIPRLPASLPVPVLVVQHMPPLFTKLLAERLDARSALEVVEVSAEVPVVAGRVYVASGGAHMVARRRGASVVVTLDDGPPENSCKPAADVTFRSAVEVWGGRVLAVVLTGMGQDGLEGCRRICEAGGAVVAQDEASSVVWGMPGAVSRAGLASEILPLPDVAPAIGRHLGRALAGSPA